MLHAFHNANFYTGREVITGKVLVTQDKIIKGFLDKEEVPEGAQWVDCKGGIVAPGFIDLQIYGGGGFLFSQELTDESLETISNALVRSGTTSFYITLATNSIEVLTKAIDTVKKQSIPALKGLHLEGPYLNPEKKGAHIEKYLRKPKLKEVQELVAYAEGTLKMMTLAPEMCDPKIIEWLAAQQILVSAGHSNATFGEAMDGFAAGCKTVTHLFNAMSPMHHRNTGLPGATFLHPEARASIIADGIHVDFQALKISKKLLGERLFLITDAVEEVKQGAYIHVRQKDRFTLPDGTLSGSALTLALAVKNCVEHADIPLDEALRMATEYPAQLSGIPNLGKLADGWTADLAVLDKDLNLQFTVSEGEVIHPGQ